MSDKALSCPHCGYPLKQTTPKRQNRRSPKRRRLPNGFGQISEIKGQNLRKPFRAMVSLGKSPTGRPICKPLKPQSYFETYNDAYAALLKYNQNPYDLEPSITMMELFNRWSPLHFDKLNQRRADAMESAWKYAKDIYAMRVNEVRTRHLKGCIENSYIMVEDERKNASDVTKNNLKTLLNQMFDYAVEYEITDKNYARMFKLNFDPTHAQPKSPHIAFTDDEMAILWDNLDRILHIDIMLIQCYSGWRPQELCDLRLDDVDIENWSFKGGMKTKAGTNRIVPIHTKIRELVRSRYQAQKDLGETYLFSCSDGNNCLSGKKLNYTKYKKRFKDVIGKLYLNPDHRPHDCRVQFVTSAKKAKVDEYVIKLLVGHAIEDITEKTYTRRDLEWLRSEIEKIS